MWEQRRLRQAERLGSGVRPIAGLMSAERRCELLGIAVSHADDCPGVHFPGVGLVWDRDLPNAIKHAVIDRLLAELERK